MKKIFFLLSLFVIIISTYPQTLIPKTIDFLSVYEELEGGTVVVYNSMIKKNTNCTVLPGGKTYVMLERGCSYVIGFSGKTYYPNGDMCTVPYSYATYLGERTWLNTADFIALKRIGVSFTQYLVIWPTTQ